MVPRNQAERILEEQGNDLCKDVCSYGTLIKNFFLCIDMREREGEGREKGGESERNINLLFHLFLHSLVASFMCPDQGWNPQCWCIRGRASNQLGYLARVVP